jgi:hypothetical protein
MKFSCSLCSGLVLFSRNLKKAVTFLRQKRRTTQHAVITFFRKSHGGFFYFMVFSGGWVSGVLRAASGFTPVLDCFVVLAVGVWLMRTGAAYPQRSDSPSRLGVFLRVHLFRPSAGGPADATRGKLSLSTFGLLELKYRGICHAQVDLGKPS